MNTAAGPQRLLRIGRNVADLDRAIAFYRDALGFHRLEHDDRPAWARLPATEGLGLHAARLGLGGQEIELVAFDPPGAPYPADSTAADLWFQHLAIVTDDMPAAYQRLLRHGITPITRGGPQRLPAAAGGVVAYKFRDPDGHPLELIEFPSDRGETAPQRAAPPALTLGIDHSAIAVADADRSGNFYGALLGLGVAARQVNHGPEQQRLDALPDVAVDVVAMQPAKAPPHIELLGYRQPRGRAQPVAGLRDIAADRLVLQVEALAPLLETLAAAGVPLQRCGAEAAADAGVAALLRDPDGHWLALVAGAG